MAADALTLPLSRAGQTPSAPLSALREDLHLLPAPRQLGGAPVWQLYDPVRHIFFRIGWREFEILSRWHLRKAESIAAAINRETTLSVSEEQVTAVQRFLAVNSLLQSPPGERQAKALRSSQLLARIITQGFYRRLPLLHPDSFLAATLPTVRFLFRPLFWLLTFLAGATGLYLAARQWQVFIHTFPYFFTLPGFIVFTMTMAAVKVIHELGHGYTAKYFGLRVPVMGIAFIFVWPLLYTDTTDAWRLREKKQRLAVGAAGVLIELAIAAYATLLWSFLEPGPLRSAVFLVATTTWLQSLMVNLNPFMRFDGYYLLADHWDIANLQPRSFMVARRYLRRLLLGIAEPCPENLPDNRRRWLLVYALATWLYRLFLFTSIALLVYFYTFKLLGLFLLVTEIGWFIGRPILLELRNWWRLRRGVGILALLRTSLAAACLLMLFLSPWQWPVQAPAILKHHRSATIYAPASGRLAEIGIAKGQQVQQGDLLFVIQSPTLDYLEKKAALEVAALKLQLQRTGLDGEKVAQIRVREQQLIAAKTALAGYRKQKERLLLKAPLAGTAAEVAEALVPGRWLQDGEPLALIVEPGSHVIEGYLRERDVGRLASGAAARFYPEHTELPAVPGRILEINPTHEKSLSEPILTSLYGGGLAARQTRDGSLVSTEAIYRFTMAPDAAIDWPRQMLRGTVRLEARPQSLFARFRLAVLRVAIRESDF